jgi:glucose-6-phosphate 1-dehydrogenase
MNWNDIAEYRINNRPRRFDFILAHDKHPGPEMKGMATELIAVDQDQSGEMEAYERLLTDAMKRRLPKLY